MRSDDNTSKFLKIRIILAKFKSVSTIPDVKVMKIISSDFDRTVFKRLRISTDILQLDLLIYLILVWKFHLQFHQKLWKM